MPRNFLSGIVAQATAVEGISNSIFNSEPLAAVASPEAFPGDDLFDLEFALDAESNLAFSPGLSLNNNQTALLPINPAPRVSDEHCHPFFRPSKPAKRIDPYLDVSTNSVKLAAGDCATKHKRFLLQAQSPETSSSSRSSSSASNGLTGLTADGRPRRRKPKVYVAEEHKDEAYRKHRELNNARARASRQKKKQQEQLKRRKLPSLETTNAKLVKEAESCKSALNLLMVELFRKLQQSYDGEQLPHELQQRLDAAAQAAAMVTDRPAAEAIIAESRTLLEQQEAAAAAATAATSLQTATAERQPEMSTDVDSLEATIF